MFKKITFVLAMVIFFFFSLKFALSAQRYAGEDKNFPDFSQRFAKIETKLELMSKSIDAANKEMARKLDQALSNQEKILKELAIVKIRASKR